MLILDRRRRILERRIRELKAYRFLQSGVDCLACPAEGRRVSHCTLHIFRTNGPLLDQPQAAFLRDNQRFFVRDDVG